MSKLLCSFSDVDNVHNVFYKLRKKYKQQPIKVFVLQDVNNDYKLYCVYNLDAQLIESEGILDQTIIVNRKKEFNCIYTINALNILGGDEIE